MPMIFFGMGLTNWLRLLLLIFWVPSIICQLWGFAPMLEWLWTKHDFWWTGLVAFTVWMIPRRRKKQVVLPT